MQLVIDISNYNAEWIKNAGCIPDILNYEIADAIIDGTSLPEGHGRLIDADSFKETLDYYIREAGWSKEHNESLEWCKEFIDAELTVIEADKTESGE